MQRPAAGARTGDALRGWTTCLDDRPASEGCCRYQTAQVLEKMRSMVDMGPSVQDSDVDLATDVERWGVLWLWPSACIKRMHRRPSQKPSRSFSLWRETRTRNRRVLFRASGFVSTFQTGSPTTSTAQRLPGSRTRAASRCFGRPAIRCLEALNDGRLHPTSTREPSQRAAFATGGVCTSNAAQCGEYGTPHLRTRAQLSSLL